MMNRYLLDTNIFVYAVQDRDSLNNDVLAILEDYESVFYMSAESVKELIVAYRNKRLLNKQWKTAYDMVRSITDDYYISILPVDNEVMKTYSTLEINEAEDHKDPSDHIIICQAMTNRMPLISSDHKFLFYKNQGLDLIYNDQ
jgi:PIN domain nuclease of toxin-antitoxin system